MRADTGTPELGFTGVDLDLFCPRGEWGEANAVQEQCSTRSAKRNKSTRGAEIPCYGTASGRNDSTNKNLHEKNSEMISRQLGDKRLASLVVLGSRILRERVNEL